MPFPRSRILVVVGLVVAVVAFAGLEYLGARPSIATYVKIRPAMSERDVQAVMGGPGAVVGIAETFEDSSVIAKYRRGLDARFTFAAAR